MGRQPELLISLRRGAGPRHVQIEQTIRQAIRSGRLRAGDELPSTRTLASDLAVSRGVVVEAYAQLVAEGYLAAQHRGRTQVAATMARPASATVLPVGTATAAIDFRPGMPDVSRFPREAWNRATRRAMARLRPAHLRYGDPRGTIELRAALADYLGRVRHVMAEPSQIVVCAGFAQGLRIAAAVLAARGIRRIGVEDPGQTELLAILREAGLVPVPICIDEHGIDVAALRRSRAPTVLVSPAHQTPTGAVLSPSRRQELIAWCVERGGYIVEDDYDAEYRYDRTPVGALQGIAPDRVIYASSASKVLAPAMRLGWLALPAALVGAAADRKYQLDLGSSVFDQLSYAEMLRSGEIDRHLRRMRAVYRQRRDRLTAALARHLPRWEPHGIEGGLHLMVRLPAGHREDEIVRRAAARSVAVYPLAAYDRSRQPPRARPGLLLGYGAVDDAQIREGVRRLAEVVAELESRHASRTAVTPR